MDKEYGKNLYSDNVQLFCYEGNGTKLWIVNL